MKATLTHIAVHYSEGIQKSISEHTCGTLKHNVRLVITPGGTAVSCEQETEATICTGS